MIIRTKKKDKGEMGQAAGCSGVGIFFKGVMATESLRRYTFNKDPVEVEWRSYLVG
jgi:hypothetical protein